MFVFVCCVCIVCVCVFVCFAVVCSIQIDDSEWRDWPGWWPTPPPAPNTAVATAPAGVATTTQGTRRQSPSWPSTLDAREQERLRLVAETRRRLVDAAAKAREQGNGRITSGGGGGGVVAGGGTAGSGLLPPGFVGERGGVNGNIAAADAHSDWVSPLPSLHGFGRGDEPAGVGVAPGERVYSPSAADVAGLAPIAQAQPFSLVEESRMEGGGAAVAPTGGTAPGSGAIEAPAVAGEVSGDRGPILAFSQAPSPVEGALASGIGAAPSEAGWAVGDASSHERGGWSEGIVGVGEGRGQEVEDGRAFASRGEGAALAGRGGGGGVAVPRRGGMEAGGEVRVPRVQQVGVWFDLFRCCMFY